MLYPSLFNNYSEGTWKSKTDKLKIGKENSTKGIKKNPPTKSTETKLTITPKAVTTKASATGKKDSLIHT